MGKKVRRAEGGRFSFYCDGCGEMHMIQTPQWNFNGNLEAPTFSPSVRISTGHFASGWKPGEDCWCTFNAKAEEPVRFRCGICHFHVKDGKVQYCDDCTHALKGKTVPLADIPE